MLRRKLPLLIICVAMPLFAAAGFELISSDSLRTNITWLAADEREGRMTPSPELDASAEYLAARFREAGLAPMGSDGSYFQSVAFAQVAPKRHSADTATVRNVVGFLRGSDPALRDQFVIVSAHYDHVGVKKPGRGDRIYNGANDNASGAASLIEIAKALSSRTPHPRRSVLFLALFGEEEGLLGSHYYVGHPLVPLARTIADVNLEQLGRTDSSDGREIAKFAFTGPSYSNLPSIMKEAAKVEGVGVYRKETGDDYFNRSDNYEFAKAGIVAHTICVAFEFPDYHEVSDEAGKIDYVNLAKVDRGIAAGVEALADAAEAPKWSDISATQAYRRR